MPVRAMKTWSRNNVEGRQTRIKPQTEGMRAAGRRRATGGIMQQESIQARTSTSQGGNTKKLLFVFNDFSDLLPRPQVEPFSLAELKFRSLTLGCVPQSHSRMLSVSTAIMLRYIYANFRSESVHTEQTLRLTSFVAR